jgi:hypothetical protein
MYVKLHINVGSYCISPSLYFEWSLVGREGGRVIFLTAVVVVVAAPLLLFPSLPFVLLADWSFLSMHMNRVKGVTLQLIAPFLLWLQSHILTVFGHFGCAFNFAAQIWKTGTHPSNINSKCKLLKCKLLKCKLRPLPPRNVLNALHEPFRAPFCM